MNSETKNTDDLAAMLRALDDVDTDAVSLQSASETVYSSEPATKSDQGQLGTLGSVINVNQNPPSYAASRVGSKQSGSKRP